MPKVSLVTANKEAMPSFVPYLVIDSDNNEQSIVMKHETADTVIWFDQDGWIGHSSIEYFNRDNFILVRPLGKGESFTGVDTMRKHRQRQGLMSYLCRERDIGVVRFGGRRMTYSRILFIDGQKFYAW